MDTQEACCQDLADVCELAHQRTVVECKKKHIRLNCTDKFQDGDCVSHDTNEEHYSDRAQVIFDGHYDEITEVTGL